jgi:hypothetical protein
VPDAGAIGGGELRGHALQPVDHHVRVAALAENVGQLLDLPQRAAVRVLRDMSEDEIREYAKSHGWRIIRRLGGRQIEFYNDASVRAP